MYKNKFRNLESVKKIKVNKKDFLTGLTVGMCLVFAEGFRQGLKLAIKTSPEWTNFWATVGTGLFILFMMFLSSRK